MLNKIWVKDESYRLGRDEFSGEIWSQKLKIIDNWQ